MDVLLTVALAAINCITAVLGVVVSLNPPEKERHKRWIAVFVMGGVAGVLLTLCLALRASHDQANLQGKIDSVNSQLIESRLEQARVSGHLEVIQSIMENLSKSGWPGMKEIAAAIAKWTYMQSSTKDATNKQACDISREVAKHLRALDAKQRPEEDEAFRKTVEAMRGAKTPLEQQQIWSQGPAAHVHAFHEYELGQMLGEVLYVRDMLQQKLPAEAQSDLATRVVFSGHLTGKDPLISTANYFDLMAGKLCAK